MRSISQVAAVDEPPTNLRPSSMSTDPAAVVSEDFHVGAIRDVRNFCFCVPKSGF